MHSGRLMDFLHKNTPYYNQFRKTHLLFLIFTKLAKEHQTTKYVGNGQMALKFFISTQ